MRLRSAGAGLLLAAAVTLGRAAPAPARPAAPAPSAVHYAGLVVHTGTQMKTACVPFSEDTITGRQLLERAAGIDPVFATYGGQGTAVCALCGIGCPAADCLTCDPSNYWAYHRAAAGATRFSYSAVGAGTTTVRPGDVDGWRWGGGSAPPFQSFTQLCPMAAPTTTAAPAPPPTQPPPTAPPTSAAGSSGTTSAAPASAPSTAITGASDTTAANTGATSTTRPRPEPSTTGGRDTEVAGSPVAGRSSPDGGAGGWVGSALGFTVAMAIVVGLTVRLRRTRRTTG